MKNFITCLLLSIFFLFYNFHLFGQVVYPFTLPSSISATFDVDTLTKEVFNNKLIGYNMANFSTTKEKDLVRKFDPVTIRFPSGLWSNFYNWETDSYTRYNDTGYNNEIYGSIIEVYNQIGHRGGFPGLTQLYTEKKQKNNGVGYNMLWTYNLNYDSNLKSVRRLLDSEAKGFEVSYIELGNEIFWANQRCTRISTYEKYYSIVRSLSDTLKKIRPNIKLSIPLSDWDFLQDQKLYNTTVTKDLSYFDAISYHFYVNGPISNPTKITESYKTVLTSRLAIKEGVTRARSYAPGKPIWLTEWGVTVSDDCLAAGALAMADCYLYLFENQNIYERAEWYTLNDPLNSFITVSDNYEVKYPLEKTGYGSVYEIIRNVFENSTLFSCKMATTQITFTKGSTNVVNARAVHKNGKTMVFAVNMADKEIDFNLKFNGNLFNSAFSHRALSFKSLDEKHILGVDVSPLKTVKVGSGAISLPPLSVSVITIDNAITSVNDFPDITKEEKISLVYPNPSCNGKFSLNIWSKWEVYSNLGEKVLEGEGKTIDLSVYPKGMYFLKTQDPYEKLICN